MIQKVTKTSTGSVVRVVIITVMGEIKCLNDLQYKQLTPLNITSCSIFLMCVKDTSLVRL